MTTNANVSDLRDLGGVRGIQARWIIECQLKLESATRLGGRTGGPVDMPVLRDSLKGCPLLTGSTLAGSLRSCLADRLAGYGTQEVAEVAALFGSSRGDDNGSQSPLIVFDSYGKLPDKQHVEIRDNVKIDGPHGTAESRKKFDGEVLPAGTSFPIRLELVVPQPIDDGKTPSEEQLLSLMLAALDGLASGDISLGARRSRGMGRLATGQWKARRFDFSTADGWLKWLKSDAELPLENMKAHDSAQAACGIQSAIARKLTLSVDQRERVRITAKLTFSGGLLVRSPARQADAPDVVHVKSGGQSVLPGTSLAGVLRNRAIRIARLVGGSASTTDKADKFVDELFGPQLYGTSDRNFNPQASKLRVSESAVHGGKRLRPTRIRIDRFTQGVFESALFDEEPDFGGRVTVTLELRNPAEGQLGLLLLLVKDLLSGDIAVGGTASVGRGVASGTANLEFRGGTQGGKRIALDPATPLKEADLEIVDAEIRALHQKLTTDNRNSP